MKNISEMTAGEASGIRYVLMDIDDTITSNGKLPAASYDALWKLHAAGLKVLPVTGRPAGWCDLIAREWPVDGVVGENGAFVFWEEPGPHESGGQAREGQACGGAAEARRSAPRLPVLRAEYHPGAVRNNHPVLLRVRERAFAEVPGLRDAKDQFARLFDIALDFAEEDPVLPLGAAERVKAIAEEEGAVAKISSIHVNIWMGEYDKLSMAEHFLGGRFGWRPEGPGRRGGGREVVFAGDSPNDEPMFARFPLSCAVANIRRYEGLIGNLPGFVSTKECGEGFAEIAGTILKMRSGYE
ncbi:MAG: HAD hydrolase family protein [Treponema sp.]|jgi:hydroxymethylpyrimidine pyrophosphatase-like HAD family hydrolase|nr:HAD hydrolase family protein [Treponema sp.]